MEALIFEYPLTYAVIPLGAPEARTILVVILDIVGKYGAAFGMVIVKFTVFVPIVVLPDLVTHVIVQVPEVELVIRLDTSGMVHDTLSPALELIVPVVAPILYVMVCVKELEALSVYIFTD